MKDRSLVWTLMDPLAMAVDAARFLLPRIPAPNDQMTADFTVGWDLPQCR